MQLLTPVNKYRIAANLSTEVVASSLGMSNFEYDDLENKYSELYIQLSLEKVRRLMAILKTSYVEFFEIPDDLADLVASKSLDELRLVLRERLQKWPAVKDELRWDVIGFLADATAGQEWNLDELRDVCSALGLYWPSYLLA